MCRWQTFILTATLWLGSCAQIAGLDEYEIGSTDDSETATETDTSSNTDSVSETETDTSSSTDSSSDTDFQTDTGFDSASDSSGDSDSSSDSAGDTDTDTATAFPTDTDTGNDTTSDADSDTVTESSDDTADDSDTGPCDAAGAPVTRCYDDYSTILVDSCGTDIDDSIVECGVNQHGYCNPQTNACDGCQPGWTGDSCDICLVYVDGASATSGDGRSWQNAKNTLQNGLAVAAASQCDVWVTQGVYYAGNPGASRNSSFTLPPDISVFGGFSGGERFLTERNSDPSLTVLSGDCNRDDGTLGNDDNVYHVVHGANNALMDGFTISGGNASGEDASGRGGGMITTGGTSLITNCSFENNFGGQGGALAILNTDAVIDNVLFYNNAAKQNGGGAIFSMGTGGNESDRNDVAITNSQFSYNSGSAIYNSLFSTIDIAGGNFNNNSHTASGGAIANLSDYEVALSNVLFSENESEQQGGAIYQMSQTFLKATIADCFFSRNTGTDGGAIYTNLPLTIVNSVFNGNSSTSGLGGAIATESMQHTIHNSRFYNNIAQTHGGALSIGEISGGVASSGQMPVVEIANSEFWKNTAAGNGGAISTVEGVSFTQRYVNNTLVANSAGLSGAGIFIQTTECDSSNECIGMLLANNILWANLASGGGMTVPRQIFTSTVTTGDPTVQVTHSVIQGGCDSASLDCDVSNITLDPLFINQTTGDLGLQSGSPAVNSGNNTYLPADIFDLDTDSDTAEASSLDANGLPRITSGTVDIGCKERQL